MIDHIFFDVETTGLDPRKNEIIEVCAIRTDADGNIKAAFTNRVRPKGDCDPQAAAINGYNPGEWDAAPSFDVVYKSLRNVILDGNSEKFVLVAHNAEFDRRFWLEECSRRDLEDPFKGRRWVDTCSMAWPLVVCGAIKSVKLEVLANYYQVVNDNPHTAEGDAMTLCQVYWKLIGRYSVVIRGETTAREVGSNFMRSIKESMGM